MQIEQECKTALSILAENFPELTKPTAQEDSKCNDEVTPRQDEDAMTHTDVKGTLSALTEHTAEVKSYLPHLANSNASTDKKAPPAFNLLLPQQPKQETVYGVVKRSQAQVLAEQPVQPKMNFQEFVRRFDS